MSTTEQQPQSHPTPVAFSVDVHSHPNANSKVKDMLERESREFIEKKLRDLNQGLSQLDKVLDEASKRRKQILKEKVAKAHADVEHSKEVVHQHETDLKLNSQILKRIIDHKLELARALRESHLLFRVLDAETRESYRDSEVHQTKHRLDMQEQERREKLAEKLNEKMLSADLNREMHIDEIREKAALDVQHAKEVALEARQQNMLKAAKEMSYHAIHDAIVESNHDVAIREKVEKASHENQQVREKRLQFLMDHDPELGAALKRVIQCEDALVGAMKESFMHDFSVNSLQQVLEQDKNLSQAIREYLDTRYMVSEDDNIESHNRIPAARDEQEDNSSSGAIGL